MARLVIRWRNRLRRNNSLLTDVAADACFFVGKAEFHLSRLWTYLLLLFNHLAYLWLLDLSLLSCVVLQSKDTLIYQTLLRDFLLVISGWRFIIGDLDLLTSHIFIRSFLVFL